MSADAPVDARMSESHFVLRVSVPETEAAKVHSELIALGQPAGGLLQTGARAVMDYLLRSIEQAVFSSMSDP